jgi:hypothetical protein
MCCAVLWWFGVVVWWCVGGRYPYIPTLTSAMIDAHCMPQPYVLGIRTSALNELSDVKDVVIVDVDHNLIRSFVPINPLPQKEGKLLWMRLRAAVDSKISASDALVRPRDAAKAREEVMLKFDTEVYDAILRFYADILIGYPKYLFFISDVPFFNG